MAGSGRPAGAIAAVGLLSLVAALSPAQTSFAATQAGGTKSPAPSDARSNSAASASRFQQTLPGHPVSRAAGVSPKASPQTLALAFLAGPRSQVEPSGQNTELDLGSVQPSAAHGTVVRFGEKVNGIPVFGGEVLVDLDKSGNVRSAASESLPGAAPDSAASISPAQASATALADVANRTGADATELTASQAEKWIYDPRILGVAGFAQSALVWRTEVTSTSGPSVNRIVLVDADSGSVTLDLDQIRNARDRQVCDANNAVDQVPCTAPVRTEGGPPTAITDVDDAYEYSGDTYDFFSARFGRDSLDNHGMSMLSTVRYCDGPDVCPYDNAFWDGVQTVYGAGYSAADDAVAHELTHGVTMYMSDLIYENQSGAINESLSDVFGEFVDLTNSGGTDTDATRWLVGEDLPTGPVRSMANPPAFDHADRMGSPLYYTGVDDDGGVHSNSGVGNKFASLITDGATFNGRTVTGLGVGKASQIIYWAANLLTQTSDYAAYGQALQASCGSLVGTNGITEADCDQVEKAGQAVEIIPTLTAPMVPAVPAALPGNGQASVAWVAPADGQSAITDYLVQYSDDGGSSWRDVDDDVSSGTAATVTGLTNGTEYVFRVAAKNLIGTGDYSPASASVSPGTSAPSGYYVAHFVGAPIAVPDNNADGVMGEVAVPAGIGPITKVTVTLGRIDSTYDQDLTISLISPDGTVVVLSEKNGGSSDDYLSTVFDDGAADTIKNGEAPFSSTFRPEGSLASLNGQSPTGNWKLKVVDDGGADFATVTAWSVTIWGPHPQTITFAPPGSTSLAVGTVGLSATATSGLAVTFTTATSGICTVTGATVALVSAGTCTVNANQAGNAIWVPAPQVVGSFQVTAVVSPPTPVIKENQNRLSVKTSIKVHRSFAVPGRTNAGIPVMIRSSSTRVCKVSRSSNHWKVTGKHRGVCTLKITNAGNATWKPFIQNARVRVR